MDCWSILGIKPTKDRLTVKDAYTEKLKITNPEDDPEGFMSLRQAYDDAVAFTKKKDDEASGEAYDDSPLGQFIKKVDEVYCDYSRRIDVAEWAELLNDDMVVGIDCFHETRVALLEYIMRHHIFPGRVWKKVDEALAIREDMEELQEKFPPDFLDYCMNNAHMPDPVDFDAFTDKTQGLKYDEFVELYIQMTNSIFEGNLDAAQNFYDRLEDLELEHPDLISIRARLLGMQGDEDYAFEIVQDGLLDFPDSLSLGFSLTNMYQKREEYDRALEGYDDLEKRFPENVSVKVGRASCYMAMGRYLDCKILCRKILNSNRFNDYVHGMMIQVNEYLIRDFGYKWRAGGLDEENTLELAWCYYQNGDFRSALDVLDSMKPEGIMQLDIYYLTGRCELMTGRTSQAIQYLKLWLAHFEEYRTAEGEAGDRNRDRQGLTHFFIAECYEEKNDYARALEYNEKGIARATIDLGMLYNQRGIIFYRQGCQEKAIEMFDRSISVEPQNFEAMVGKGDAYLKLNRYMDALREYDSALSINMYDSRANAGRIKVLTIFEAYNQAEELLDNLRRDVELTDELLFVESMLLEKKGDKVAAQANLREIARRFKTEPDHYTDLSEPADVFYEIAVMHYDSKEKDRLKQAAYWLNKGLKLKPRDCDLLFFRGNVYAEQGRLDLAEKFLIKCIKCGGDEELLYYRLGKIFMKADPAKAARYLKITLEKFPENKKARKALRDLTGGKK